MSQFYRKKEAGKPDAFYEQGTDRYIGPTEFAGGAGWQEVQGPVSPAGGAAPPGGQPDTVFNPVDYYQKNIIEPERKRFEERLEYQRGLPSREDAIRRSREEVGLPSVIAAGRRTQGAMDELNNYLDKLETDLQIGQRQIQTSSTPSVIAGRQGSFLNRDIAAERAPLTLQLGALGRTMAATTAEQDYLDRLAQQMADARISQNEQPLREYEDRSQFEGQQARDLFELLLAQSKGEGADEMDKLLTPTEAARLGVPYGTTRGEAAMGNITPKYGSGSGSTPTPPTDPAKFSPSEMKDLEAVGALGWSRQAQNFILQRLSSTQRNNFILDWQKEQNTRRVSVDPMQYYEYWITQQKKSSSSSSTAIPRPDFSSK